MDSRDSPMEEPQPCSSKSVDTSADPDVDMEALSAGAAAMQLTDEPPRGIIIKWWGNEIEIEDMSWITHVRDLKLVLQAKTGVPRDDQILWTNTGSLGDDWSVLADLGLTMGHKITMISRDRGIHNVGTPPEERLNTNNDMDVTDDDEEILINQGSYEDQVAASVQKYRIHLINIPRPDKKLLVLDLDHTLVDYQAAPKWTALRPFLDKFLALAYEDYDIAIWSATGTDTIRKKMKFIWATTSTYKILFYLDLDAMTTVETLNHEEVLVKPLALIWGQFEEYSAKNTIIIDDLRRNFLLNPQSGLEIRPYYSTDYSTDRELSKVSEYLKKISKLDDFTVLDHSQWESYEEKPPSLPGRRTRSGSRSPHYSIQ